MKIKSIKEIRKWGLTDIYDENDSDLKNHQEDGEINTEIN
jgi:hypothetical protein